MVENAGRLGVRSGPCIKGAETGQFIVLCIQQDFFFPLSKYCKYTITTIINTRGSLHFHPFLTLKSQGIKKITTKRTRTKQQ